MIPQFVRVGFFILLCFQTAVAYSQEQKPYWNEIKAFQLQDSLQPQPKGAILFVGSSSFRLWKDVDKAFPGHTIINRGFGGSSLPHLIQYADEIIFQYQPKQIVIYCGENDLTAEGITGDTVFQRFKNLFSIIRNRLTNVPIVFVSIKPSPSRWHLKGKMITANRLIKNFLATKKNTAFVNVWALMLDKNGKPREELFVADRLHMNDEGYAVWTKKLKPYLLNTKQLHAEKTAMQ